MDAVSRKRAATTSSQAVKFLKDPEAEFSTSFTPKLGIYPYNFQSGPAAQHSLKYNILERSKRVAQISPNHLLFVDNNLMGLDEAKRKQCREALQQWQLRQQQRDREPTTLSKEDGLYKFMDQVAKKQTGGLELDEWLFRFSTSQESFFEFIETCGCPEPKQFASKTVSWVVGLLDTICDKKIPNNRAVWLIKYVMLANLGKDLKIHLAPRGWTEHMLGWLGKLLDTMGKGIDAENRWKRGTSLVRWMFEDGLLSSRVLFDELLKIWRSAFGASSVNAASTSVGMSRIAGTAVSAHKLYSDRVQTLVATEVVSYTTDAIRLGYAKEFFDCASQILPSVANNAVRPLFQLCMSLCLLELETDTPQQEFWRNDSVSLAWDLEKLKFSLQDEDVLGKEVWRAVQRAGFAPGSIQATTALVDWCSQDGDVDALNREERIELVCFALIVAKSNNSVTLDACPELLASLHARRNPAMAPHSPSCFAFVNKMLDCAMEMESTEIINALQEISPPIARARALCWLLKKCGNATLNLALMPFMENSLLVRRMLIKPNSELRSAIELRCTPTGVAQPCEQARLNDLLLVANSMSPHGGGNIAINGGITSNVLLGLGLSPTPQPSALLATTTTSQPQYRKRTKQNASLMYNFEFEDAAKDEPTSPTGAGATPQQSATAFTPALLHTEGFAGEVARYEFGVYKLSTETLDRIVDEIKSEPDFLRLLRDFTCCRDMSKDRQMVINECLSRNLEQAVCLGLVTLEEVLNDWVSKRFVPSASPTLPLCPKASHPLVQRQWKQLTCFSSQSPTVFRLVNHFMLLGKNKLDTFADMYKSVGAEWVSQGPTALWQKETKRFSDDLREMLRSKAATVAPQEEWRNAWRLATLTWFTLYQDEEMLRVGLQCGNDEDDEKMASNVASVVKAWDMQETACQRLFTAFQSQDTTVSQSLFARLLSLGGPKTEALCKQLVSEQITQSTTHERLCAAALFHAPVGMMAPDWALQRLSDSSALLLLGEDERITVELIKQAAPLHQSDVQSLDFVKQVWQRLENPETNAYWSTLIRKAVRDEGQQPPARTRMENLIRLSSALRRGNASSTEEDDGGFVDAWLVLECAYDTLANRAFLRPPPPLSATQEPKSNGAAPAAVASSSTPATTLSQSQDMDVDL